MDELFREFRTSFPWELLYTDDLVLMLVSIEVLEKKFSDRKKGMESKSLRVNIGNTKVMVSSVKKIGQYPCDVSHEVVGTIFTAIPANVVPMHAAVV